jgi:hypothetical protein
MGFNVNAPHDSGGGGGGQWNRMQEIERASASARKAKVAAEKQRAKEDRKVWAKGAEFVKNCCRVGAPNVLPIYKFNQSI